MKAPLAVTAALILLNYAGFSQQQELSPQYYSVFGEQGALVYSSKAFPQKASYDASLFDYKGGKFYIQAGSGAKLYGRFVLPKGKTFRGYLDKVKKDNAEKMKTRKGDYIEIRYWVSHDERGVPLAKDKWPSSKRDEPKWAEPKLRTWDELNDRTVDWNGIGIDWKGNFETDMSGWLEKAKDGFKVYALATVTVEREAVEHKYWDKNQLTYVTPLEWVRGEPIAAATMEVKGAGVAITEDMTFKIDALKKDKETKNNEGAIMDIFWSGSGHLCKNGTPLIEVKFKVTESPIYGTYVLDTEDEFSANESKNDMPTVQDAIKNAMHKYVLHKLGKW
jgi:hypothetical protein